MYMYMYVYISFIEAERGEGERNRHTSSRMTDGLMEFPAWATPLASVWVLVTGQSGLLREQGVGQVACSQQVDLICVVSSPTQTEHCWNTGQTLQGELRVLFTVGHL